MRALLVFVFILGCSGTGWAKDIELVALGVRGGMNFKDAGLQPGEKEDFEQFDVFGIMGLPWGGKVRPGGRCVRKSGVPRVR